MKKFTIVAGIAACVVGVHVRADQTPFPKVMDGRLKISLVAVEPDIVTPTGITVDASGGVLCIENHTHQRDENYDGSPTDRIKMFQDTDGDHRADRITTFFEGTKDTMNLAACADGSVYVATRREVFRLMDTDGDGRADQSTRIARLKTVASYPHNGLSGFAFDAFGNVFFGLGENSGESYDLIGSDGTTLSGGGEGGSIYRCTLDGSKLVRIATGLWNPFHLCLDLYGRIFVVDNDPHWRPPCRLLHIVMGGDYGYRYRLGAQGIHPFNSWFGELPGTLGMVAGTGEAPSGIIAYQSDNLPADYRGDLLCTSWGVHAIERYRLTRRGASFSSVPETIVRGDRNFRPVGIALAPDGSLYISDWVDRAYSVHGKGRIWRLSRAEPFSPDRPADPRDAFLSAHQPLRSKAARQLIAEGEPGLAFLRAQLIGHEDEAVRATALVALVASGNQDQLTVDVLSDDSPHVRELAASVLPEDLWRVRPLTDQAEAVLAAELRRDDQALGADELMARYFSHGDAFIRQAARYAVSQRTTVEELLKIAERELALRGNPGETNAAADQRRLSLVLLLRAADDSRAEATVPRWLADPDLRIRFAAVQWIGERKLTEYKAMLLESLRTGNMAGRLFEAHLAAVQLLTKDEKVYRTEVQLGEILSELLNQDDVSSQVKALALRKLNWVETSDFRAPTASPVDVERLIAFVQDEDANVGVEAVRALRAMNEPKAREMMVRLATDSDRPLEMRAEAVMGCTAQDRRSRQALFELASAGPGVLRAESLRSLRGASFSKPEIQRLEAIQREDPDSADSIARLLDVDWKMKERPSLEVNRWNDWIKRGDKQAGQRIFFHPNGPRCYVCHQIDGRGGRIGPDLSAAAAMGEQRLIDSMFKPSQDIAPRFVSWVVQRADGTTFTGVPVSERGEEEIFADAFGNLIYIDHSDIEQRRPISASLMPDGLIDQLTHQELRDLLAYLWQRR